MPPLLSAPTILCAMHAEADPIIHALALKPAPTPWPDALPPRLYTHPDRPLNLVVNGRDPRTGDELIGTTPATLATHLAIEHLAPSHLVVAGAAGGCSRATTIAQVLLIDRAFHHDRRIPLPEFAAYAHGPEPLHAPPAIADALGIQTASISTGNALDTLDSDLAFFAANSITVKDMETASIAWTANLTNTPTIALRAITDHYDHPAPQHQFLTNLTAALEALTNKLTHLLALPLTPPPS